MRSSTSGTRFSDARSGPAWQPTQIRCSPRRAQNHPCSCRNTAPCASSSANRIGRSAGVSTKKDPSASTGAVPSSKACPVRVQLLHPHRSRRGLQSRLRAKAAHPAPADSRNPSRAMRWDDVSAARGQTRTGLRPDLRRGAPAPFAAPPLPASKSRCVARFRIRPRAHQPFARFGLRNRARILCRAARHALLVRQRRSESRQDAPCVNTTSPDAICLRPSGPGHGSQRYDSTPGAIGIHQVHLRSRSRSQRKSRFKEDPPVGQHIVGQRVGAHVGERNIARRSVGFKLCEACDSFVRADCNWNPPAFAAHTPAPAGQIQRPNRIRCAAITLRTVHPPASTPISATDRRQPSSLRTRPSCRRTKRWRPRVAAKPATSGSALPSCISSSCAPLGNALRPRNAASGSYAAPPLQSRRIDSIVTSWAANPHPKHMPAEAAGRHIALGPIHPTVSMGLPASSQRARGPQRNVRLERRHHLVELGKPQRLLAIAPRLVRMRMYFNSSPSAPAATPIRASAGTRFAMRPRVARIRNHRQMRDLLQQRNRGHIERIARRRLKRADAALAQNHIGIAVVQYQSAPSAADRQSWPPCRASAESACPNAPPLPAARSSPCCAADLQNVRVLGNHRHIALAHHLGHDRQPASSRACASIFSPSRPMPLKCVRRTARLECASAKNPRARAAHMMGSRHQLELGLHRARTSHGDKFVAADLDVQHRDNRLLAPCDLQNVRSFGKTFVPLRLHAFCSVLASSHTRGSFSLPPPPIPRLHPKLEVRNASVSAPAFSASTGASK